MKTSLINATIAFFAIACVPEQKVVEINPFIVQEGKAPLIIAHGGSKALFPENTMLAFDGSMQIGVDALEMDASITKDGILVLHHDATIDRMSDGEGSLAEMTFEELQQFNFGFDFVNIDGNKPYEKFKVDITKLEDLIIKYPNIPMVIEIKNDGALGEKAAIELKRLIDLYGIKEHTIVASFHDEVLEYYLELGDGTYFTSSAEGESKKMVISTKSGFGVFYRPNAIAVQLPMESSGLDLTKKRIMKSAHRHNMAVHYWTINNEADMKHLIKNGADGLITDRPDIMHKILKELGYE